MNLQKYQALLKYSAFAGPKGSATPYTGVQMAAPGKPESIQPNFTAATGVQLSLAPTKKRQKNNVLIPQAPPSMLTKTAVNPMFGPSAAAGDRAGKALADYLIPRIARNMSPTKAKILITAMGVGSAGLATFLGYTLAKRLQAKREGARGK